MATYAIGDLQGCFQPLMELLEQLAFDPACDRLWFVGDLVNRGPDSLALLRFVKGLGDRAVCVLGNHDLHLVAVAAGKGKRRDGDTLDEVLAAPDRDELVDWLRQRPLMYREGTYAMVHAGLLPPWSVERALALANEVEQRLRAPDYPALLANMYGNEPATWGDDLHGFARLRVIVNAMTRLRVCDANGAMALGFKGDGASIPPGLWPWFAVPGRASAGLPIIFGHWSALGLICEPDVIGLDTGCLWGRRLSAIRLEDRQLFQVACSGVAHRAQPQ
jgi:bis(5'-nucleosyl)-tetraphosphatase (symmetrical)